MIAWRSTELRSIQTQLSNRFHWFLWGYSHIVNLSQNGFNVYQCECSREKVLSQTLSLCVNGPLTSQRMLDQHVYIFTTLSTSSNLPKSGGTQQKTSQWTELVISPIRPTWWQDPTSLIPFFVLIFDEHISLFNRCYDSWRRHHPQIKPSVMDVIIKRWRPAGDKKDILMLIWPIP